MDFHCAEHVQNFRIVFELTFLAHHKVVWFRNLNRVFLRYFPNINLSKLQIIFLHIETSVDQKRSIPEFFEIQE